MQLTLPTTRTIEIDGMCGQACIQRVASSLSNIGGVSAESVTLGFVTIDADPIGCAAACTAIGLAGFRAHERAAHGQANDSIYAAWKTRSHPTSLVASA